MVNGQWSMFNGQWSMFNGQWSMFNGQCPKFLLTSFSGFERASCGGISSCTRKIFLANWGATFLLRIDNAKVQKICEPVKKISKKQPFLRGIFRAKNAEK